LIRCKRHLHIHLPEEVKHLSEKNSSRYDHCKVSHETQLYEDWDNSEDESGGSDLDDNMSRDEAFANVKLSGRFSYNIRIDRSKRKNVIHKWHNRKRRLACSVNHDNYYGGTM
jgi:hypothetical protein